MAAGARSHLQDLPVEIVDSIVTYLELDDGRNLRLTNRLVASKVSQGTFKQYYHTKHVDLSQESLKSFAQATRADHLGHTVQELVLTGIAVDTGDLKTTLHRKARWITEHNGPMFMSTEHKCTPEELEKVEQDLEVLQKMQHEIENLQETGQDVKLLQTAFRNLVANSKNSALPSLTLKVAVYCDDGTRQPPSSGGRWEKIWKTAALTFQTTIHALSQADLPIHAFHIFTGQRRCSLACDQVGRALQGLPKPLGFLHDLKEISMSLSVPVIQEAADQQISSDLGEDGEQPQAADLPIEELQALASNEKNFTGLPCLLSAAPNLTKIDIHWSALSYSRLTIADLHEERYLDAIADNVDLPRLTSCSLRGLRASEKAVLAMLRKGPVKSVALLNIRLANGTFRSIFDLCADGNVGLETLLLDDLFEQSLVYFDKGKPKFPSLGGSYGGNTLNQQGDDIRTRRGIQYHFTSGRPLGSPQCYRWRQLRRAEYGPP